MASGAAEAAEEVVGELAFRQEKYCTNCVLFREVAKQEGGTRCSSQNAQP